MAGWGLVGRTKEGRERRERAGRRESEANGDKGGDREGSNEKWNRGNW